MKKLSVLLSLILVLSLLFSPAASAAGGNTDTLGDWNIRIAVPDQAAAAVLEGSTYYIYAQKEGYIPYVMLMATDRFDNEEAFIDYLTDSLSKQYQQQGFEVTSAPAAKTIGDKHCYEVDYAYTISGYDAVDRRIFITVDKLTYMFCTKEIPSLGMTLDGMLEEVIENAVFLSEEGTAPVDAAPTQEAESDLYPVYLYREENGMPKYWLDLTGLYSENPVLHCYFRSGDPTFYEGQYVLDFKTAEADGDTLLIYDIYDAWGNDVSDWFNWIKLDFGDSSLVMDIGRNEKTLAGGAEDNILTGGYEMEPCAANACFECRNENGDLLYWMIPNDDGDPEVHGTSRFGGDPETLEEVYILDSDFAEENSDGSVRYHQVTRNGSDISKLLESVVLRADGPSWVLTVKPEGNASNDDGLLSGTYTFEPSVRFVPAEPGPYTADELGLLARQYYFLETGFFPPEAEVTENDDGSLTVHLFEIVEKAGIPAHTATSAWYTVDPFGVGVNDITGEEVYLAG